MSRTKELLDKMYNTYDSLEGSCNQLEEHLRNLEHEYYNGKASNTNNNNNTRV